MSNDADDVIVPDEDERNRPSDWRLDHVRGCGFSGEDHDGREIVRWIDLPVPKSK